MKISVSINTFNEEKNIKNCLESVKWADEIVIVDMYSTDKTVEIAGEYTDKIFSFKISCPAGTHLIPPVQQRSQHNVDP